MEVCVLRDNRRRLQRYTAGSACPSRLFHQGKDVSKPLSARLPSRVFLLAGPGACAPCSASGQGAAPQRAFQHLTPAPCSPGEARSPTHAAPPTLFVFTARVIHFVVVQGQCPVFHHIVTSIHRGRQQVLPVIAVPERVELQDGGRRAIRPTRRCRFRPKRTEEPGDEALDGDCLHGCLQPDRVDDHPARRQRRQPGKILTGKYLVADNECFSCLAVFVCRLQVIVTSLA